MIIGQTIHSMGGVSTSYYSPWFSRGGNRAIVTCNVIAAANADSFIIAVQTKNSEDSDAGAVTPGAWSQSVTTAGSNIYTSWEAGAALGSSSDGMLELVRFRYTLASEELDCWVHFRMLAPQWFTN